MARMRTAVLLTILMLLCVGLNAISCGNGDEEAVVLPSEGLYINPPWQEAEPGQEVTINVEMRPVDRGVSAGEINLGFDASALEVTGIEPGDFFGSNPLVGLNEMDNEAGTLGYSLARVGATSVPSLPGILMIIEFRVLEDADSGTYELTLTKVGLADENFEDLTDIEVQGASIKVK